MWEDRGGSGREDGPKVNAIIVITAGSGEANLPNGQDELPLKSDIRSASSRAVMVKLRSDGGDDGHRNKRRIINKALLAFLISSLLISSLVLSIPTKAQCNSDNATLGKVVSNLGDEHNSTDQAIDGSRSSIPDYQDTMRFFIENKGQFDSDVRFVAVTEFGKALFYDSKVQYLLERYEDGNISGVDVVTLTFPGSEEVCPQGQGLQLHYTNYFVGDPSQWVSGARNYRSLVYQDLWPGIDLAYKFSEQGLKYEFIVDPFVQENRIGIQVEGAAIQSEPSCLTFATDYGRLVDNDLIASQDGSSKGISAEFSAIGNIITFQVEGRDPSKALLIDPLLYSTYVGGSQYDFSQGIVVDGGGNAYVTGQTQSADFPTFSPFQASLAGNSDAFVLKLDASGKTLIYSTYIGGSGGDYGQDIAIDGGGNAYVTGSTNSINFPTSSPMQTAYGGGTYDAFVLKLNSAGNALIYSTYIGGSGEDVGNGIDVDGGGNAYSTGYTSSNDFPTSSPLQATNGGYIDAFVLKLNTAGNALIYSTYLGGNDTDNGRNIVVDGSGNSYVTGITYSTDFPTHNPYQAVIAGSSDAFVLKLDAFGGSLVYSTYLGGSIADYGTDIAIDTSGNTYVTGYTVSTDFPISLGSFQTINRGNGDAFVLKLNAIGDSLVYSTFVGGSDQDIGKSIALDGIGNAYVTGYTNSTDFPSFHPFQVGNSGGFDAFVLILNTAGNGLILSTFFGGEDTDAAYSIALDANGNAYVTGGTYSTDLPILSAFRAINSGNCDAFVLKFNVAGDVLKFGTYVGGNAEDQGQAIALDAIGNVYVTGYTYSTNFPTSSPIQAANGGDEDVFVLKLNPAGNALIYSTYIGGGSDERGIDIAVDASGNAYVTGYTYSTNFPTSSPIQAANGGYYDAFVLKLNVAGNALVYSTYLGGSDTDFGQGIAIDTNGNAYVTGGTFSTDFPTASPLYTSNSGSCDAFILKLNGAGSALAYSSYLGGSLYDQGLDIAVDAMGNTYVTGSTNSTNFPTSSPLQAANRGKIDAFVLKLNAVGSALLYSTYVGGGGDDHGQGITVDALGDAYVTGDTNSTDFPTFGPFQEGKGNLSDAFVLKLNAAGSTLIYSTYVGGNDDDFGYNLVIDANGNAYVTGATYSTDFPTSSPFKGERSGDCDAFVFELDRAGSVLIYSTYVGGSDTDYGLSIDIDAYGNAYVTGATYSDDFPTFSPFQVSLAGDSDAFVLKIGSLTAPSVPFDLTATPSNGQVFLAWSAPTNEGGHPIDYYVVYRDGIDVAHPGSTSINITGLKNGVSYSFTVAAHNSAGVGPLTPMVNATPKASTSDDTGGNSLFIMLGILAAIIVVIIVAIFALRARRPREPAPAKPIEPIKPIEPTPTKASVNPVPPPLEEPKYCPWCGEKSGEEFCGNCGRKVD